MIAPTLADRRSLRAQLVLIGLLFVPTVALAGALVVHPPLLRRFVAERHEPLPDRLGPLAKELALGRLERSQFDLLSEPDRLLLYGDWLGHQAPAAPRVLVEAAPELYLSRAERTLVCGTPEQRTAAIRFLALADDSRAAWRVQRAERWARRRQDASLVAQLAELRQQLERRR